MFNLFLNEINSQLNKETKDLVVVTQQGVNQLVQHQDEQRRRDILKWLSPINHADKQADFFGRVQEGTGTWFLETNEFKNWITQDHDTPEDQHTLFCPELPGAGKTILTSVVVNELQENLQQAGVGVAFSYCNFREKVTLDGLFAVILRQLIQQLPSIPKDMETLYEANLDSGTRLTLGKVLTALDSALLEFSRTFIVIDALDECELPGDSRKKLLMELFELQKEHELGLFATSRDNPDIAGLFSERSTLEIRAHPEDVESFLRGRIGILPSVVQKRVDLQSEIVSTITQAIDGMFLLAHLHIESLQGRRSAKAIRDGLKTLPLGLDAAYADALNRIESQLPDEVQIAKAVLSWISCATRPLTTLELCHALAIKADEPDLNEDNVLGIDDLVTVYAGLVTVDKQSHVVRLVHYTTQEYFERNWARISPDAHCEIGTKCVNYLCLDAFESGTLSTLDEYKAHLQEYPFLKYAASNWGFHARQQQADMQLILRLLRDEGKVNACSRALLEPPYGFVHGLWGISFEDALDYMHGIHLAAYLGLLQATKALAYQDQGGFINCKNTNGGTALLLASKQGFEEIVRFLLEQGVSIDPNDKTGWTPLHHAVVIDHKKVVKILLEAGADIETMDLADHISIDCAAPPGNDRKNRSGRTPLISAAEAGNEAMAKTLLEAGADPDHYTDDYTPLTSAIRSRNMKIFTTLLEKVSDPDCADRRGRTSLMHAMRNCHAMAEHLLARGARSDVGDEDGETPLSIASQRAKEPLVKLFLEKIPGQEYVNAKGQGLRHFAAESDLVDGDEAMVRTLLEGEGLPHDQKVADAQSGLHGAAWRGYPTILDILLGIDGVDVDGKDEEGYTAFFLAARWGREATVELLIDKYGANPEVGNGEMEWTSLHGAVIFGEPATARMLLARGANPNSREVLGRIPLSWAVNVEWKNNSDTGLPSVQLLLEADGVDIDIQDIGDHAPLVWAIMSALYLVHAPEMVDMYEASVQLLIEKGARVDSRDKSGRTPVFYAAMMKCAP